MHKHDGKRTKKDDKQKSHEYTVVPSWLNPEALIE